MCSKLHLLKILSCSCHCMSDLSCLCSAKDYKYANIPSGEKNISRANVSSGGMKSSKSFTSGQ